MSEAVKVVWEAVQYLREKGLDVPRIADWGIKQGDYWIISLEHGKPTTFAFADYNLVVEITKPKPFEGDKEGKPESLTPEDIYMVQRDFERRLIELLGDEYIVKTRNLTLEEIEAQLKKGPVVSETDIFDNAFIYRQIFRKGSNKCLLGILLTGDFYVDPEEPESALLMERIASELLSAEKRPEPHIDWGVVPDELYEFGPIRELIIGSENDAVRRDYEDYLWRKEHKQPS